MASPFKTFRKYQKSALVGLGVMAMLSFIIFPLIMQYQESALRQRDTTLATCQYGKINLTTIHNIRAEQQRLLDFYAKANSQIYFDTQKESPGLRNRIETMAQFDDESAVYHWLKIQKLRDLGYSVSRDMVSSYLSLLTDNQLTEDRYLKVLDAMGVSTDSVIQLLQRDILAQIFDNEYVLSARGITPVKEFEWFCRFNRRSMIQAAAVDVTAFAGEVKEPTEKELKDFFEANKFRVQNPSLAETGFAIPKQSSVEYVSYNFNNIDISSITDEEALKYYEENKETLYKNTPQEDSLSTDFLKNFPGTNSLPFNRSLTPPTQGSLGTDLPTFQLPTSTDPVTPESPVEDATPNAPAEEPVQEPTPAAQEEGNPSSSLNREKSPFRLVAYQTESETETPAADVPAETPVEPEQAAEHQQQQETEPSSPYKPFEEVKDGIKETIARGRMKEKLDAIELQMNGYYHDMVNHARRVETARERNQELPILKRLDLKAIAEEQGFQFHQLTSRDFHSMIQDDYSFSTAMISSERFSSSAVIQVMFSTSGLVDEFPYRAANDTSGDQYLFWVTKTTEQKVPAYNDEGIADLVKKRWKEVQARPLAKAKAEQIMEEVKKSGQSLQEYFTANPNPQIQAVVETDYFPWYDEPQFTRFEMPSLQLAEVRERGVESGQALQQNKVIVAWGNRFMEDVFALQKGEYGVTLNQPENTYYIVNVLEVTPGDEDLVTLFENVSFQRMYISMFAARNQLGEMYQAMNEKIQDATKFKWQKTPSAYREEMQNQAADE